MNKKQRKRQEKQRRHEAERGTDEPVTDAPIKAGKDGHNGEHDKGEADNLENVTRWSRFKDWIKNPRLTQAELINIMLTMAIVGVTAYGVVVAILQWQAMRESNKNAADQFMASEQATLVAYAPVELWDRRGFRLTVHNFGHKESGPFWLWVSVLRSGGSIGGCLPAAEFGKDARRIYPGQDVIFFVPFCAGLTDEQLKAVRDGNEEMRVNVQLHYDNGFGERREFFGDFNYRPGLGWFSDKAVWGEKDKEEIPEKKPAK